MPLIQTTIMEGRTQEQKEAFFQAVTQAAVDHLGVKPEQVRAMINEIPSTHWSIGGESVYKRQQKSSS